MISPSPSVPCGHRAALCPLCAWSPTQQLTAPLGFSFLGCSREELSQAGLPSGVTKCQACYPGTQMCPKADQEGLAAQPEDRQDFWKK